MKATSTSNTEFDGLAVSIRSLAGLTGLDRDTIRGAIGRANLQPAGQRGGYPAYKLKDAIRALFVRHGDVDPATLTPQDRKALADAKLREHALRVKEGEYLPREAYRAATARGFSTCAQSILSLPDNLERKAGLSPEQAEQAEKVVDLILGTLYADLERAYTENRALAGEH